MVDDTRMNQLFDEFLTRHNENRRSFFPKTHWYSEFFKLSNTPNAAFSIKKESDFYNSMWEEMKGFQDLKKKSCNKQEWQKLIFCLKNYNEKLHSSIDESVAISTFFALLASVSAILGHAFNKNSFGFWFIFVLLVLKSSQLFNQRVEERRELSRNKEFINIIETYLLLDKLG
ncbi:MAG: hypothetical protein Q8N35_15980 [Methylococcaceae bacterium]|nr:hypothetical protein [Methylococcaceae bacterium]MDZ4157291.1 hypothetical protein [Methylococcales bacterium]MDP2392581.1 hypothetical protein [Methylococcaceae bacterium]MDP3021081.1 hypothetical protein [Methylococcaceae bacterium]MDP3388468.1 hypothetical protein [Methylococcaceae bacterium]